MKLRDIIFEIDNQVAATATGFNKVITSIDDSMHYGVFAKAVAKVLKDEYGSHNINPFMDVLHAELGIKENIKEDFMKFQQEADDLEKELQDTYNRKDISVTMGQYYQKDRGYGKVRFVTKNELAPAEWNNVKNFLKAKGYEITDESNWYDEDDDRSWYPSLKFEFDVNETV